MDDKPLSPDERARLRAMIEQDEKVMWLWSSLKTWTLWGAAIGGFLLVTWDHMRAAWHVLTGHP